MRLLKPARFIIGLVTVLLIAGLAGAQILDQSFTPGSGQYDQAFDHPIAQVYTAGLSGKLTSVNMWVRCTEVPVITVEIRTTGHTGGEPYPLPEDLLGTATANCPSDYSPIGTRFSFAPPIEQVAGTQYAIVVVEQGVPIPWPGYYCPTWPACNGPVGLLNDSFDLWPLPYPYLNGYQDGLACYYIDPYWVPLGAGWTVSGAQDFYFQTYVQTAPTYACVGFAAPLDVPLSLRSRTNRAIPLQAQLFGGSTLVDTSTIGAAPPVVNVSFSSGSTPATDETSLLAPIGQATSGNQFVYDPTTGYWQFNLATSPYTAAGTYTVTLQSGDTNTYLVSPQCVGRFVRQ